MKKNNGRDSRKYLRLFGLSGAIAALGMLSGCGGDSLGDGGEPAPVRTQSKAGPPHSITISYPRSNAIFDQENGVYQRKFSVLVRDQDGVPVADGTRVTLRVIDSVIAQGTIREPDSIQGNTLNLTLAQKADGTPIPDLSTVTINRSGVTNGQLRGIQANDHILLIDNSFHTDVHRRVITAPTLSNTLNVNSSYSREYPQYSMANYLIGASMLSAGVVGEIAADSVDEGSVGTLSPGEVIIGGGDGVGTGHIIYAANRHNIMSGCYPEIDGRVEPIGSAQVYVVATTGNITAVESLCFAATAGFTINPTEFSFNGPEGSSAIQQFCVEDGGDGVRLPFYPGIGVSQSSGPVFAESVNISPSTVVNGEVVSHTDANGCFTVALNRLTGSGEGEWTVIAGDADATISVETPEISLAPVIPVLPATVGSTTSTQVFILGTSGGIEYQILQPIRTAGTVNATVSAPNTTTSGAFTVNFSNITLPGPNTQGEPGFVATGTGTWQVIAIGPSGIFRTDIQLTVSR